MKLLDILIIYEPPSQKSMVNRLVEEMNKHNMLVDAFNMYQMQFHINKDKSSLFKFLSFLQFFFVLRPIIKRCFYSIILHQLCLKTKLIDIHFFSRYYVRFLEHYTRPFKLTIWGSDFFRETQYWQERKRNIYRRASLIQVATNEMKNLIQTYDASLKNRIKVCNFGVSLLSQIDKVRSQMRTEVLNKNKIFVACGYNGAKGQQHLKIFNAISQLPYELKNKLILLVPLTYGLSNKYRKQIESALSRLQCEYKLYLNKLSDEDLALLRINTDITINLQITDVLSASLIEHLYSGNVLIVGNWLPYDIFDAANIFYFKTPTDLLPSLLEDVINNIEIYKSVARDNSVKINTLFSWPSVSFKQAEIYRELLLN